MTRNKWIRAGKGLGKVLLSGVLTAWLFFDFSKAASGLLLLLAPKLVREIKRAGEEEKAKLHLAFRDALLYLRNALNAGYSPESSMREAVKGLEGLYSANERICREFHYMISQMETGHSMEEAWSDFGERSRVEDIRQFAAVFSVVKRTGGELGGVLRQTGEVLQEKVELQRELRTVIAAKEMEFRVMCMIPYGILLYLRVFAPAMTDALYHQNFGEIFMWCVLLAYEGIKFWGESIIRREVHI